ncbi:histidine kinase [Spirosoma taeanense]|uniref:histidine kinase n=1 Tax=Spirosoma taeanense TaxID=2735870 RepID=A0A6M5Y9E3_9BACT|nr:sensor histidine kinase [Spirosoma taeanense]QJW89422.1 histidine kinase [Spirosoma taeanense]
MNRRIALGFVLAVVLIALGFAMSFYSYDQYSRDSQRVQHTHQVIGQLDDLLSALKDVESGTRGYLITGENFFLESYYTALPLVPKELTQLRQLTADNPAQQQRVDTLARLVEAKIKICQRQVKEANGLTSATRNAYLHVGKVRMDLIRVEVARMIDTEEGLLKQRSEQADRSFRNALIVIFSLSLLTFVVLAISYRLLENELARRQQTEDQLRAYEARLKEQIRQLEASNEELERFAFVASHDLQEPLRKIQSFANLIMGRYANLFDGDSAMFMHKISHSAERMSKLIKDLLNFSRISNHREDFKPVRLNNIIQHILEDQELRIKGLNVQLEVGPLPVVQAVASQMDHLFANLISNALKFSRPDVQPKLRIHARPIFGSDYPELISDRRYFEITIEDNGIGFDVKYLDHIFKVFQRLHGKTAFEGTGIGLAICKRVVVYHHGYITARSQPDQGTTFVVILPESQSSNDYDQSNSSKAYSYSAG